MTKYNIKYSINNKDGMRGFVEASADHRKLTYLLDYNNQHCYSYKLPEETTPKVVIRGIPHVPNCEIKEEFASNTFEILTITSLRTWSFWNGQV